MDIRRFLFGLSTAIAVLSSAASAPAYGEIELSGEQDGYYDRNDYLVTSNVTVKKERILTFAPGSIIRFQRYSGLIIEGSLICKGTLAAPIIFTSANDRGVSTDTAKRALPFDWNGIEIRESCPQAEFDYSRVMYSSFGIQMISSATDLKVTNTVFRDNGNAHFSIGDSVVIVADNTPFSFVKNEPPAPTVQPQISDRAERDSLRAVARKARQAAAAARPPEKPWKLPVRIGTGAVTLGGAALMAVGYVKFKDYDTKYDSSESPADAQQRAEKADRMLVGYYAGMALAVLGGAGFVVTFLF
jgi:hypothetical protein